MVAPWEGMEGSVSIRMWPCVCPCGAELVICMFRAKNARLEVMSGWKIEIQHFLVMRYWVSL